MRPSGLKYLSTELPRKVLGSLYKAPLKGIDIYIYIYIYIDTYLDPQKYVT